MVKALSPATRRRGVRMALAAGVAALALLTAACSSNASTTDSGSANTSGKGVIYSGKGTVGFSIYNGAVTRWYRYDIPDIKKHLAKYAPGVTLQSYDPKGNAATQLQQVRSALVKGIDFLLLDPVEVTPTSITKQAKQAKVPVLLYLNPPQKLPADQTIGLIGDGDLDVGTIQSKWVLDNVPQGGEVAIISGDLATVYAQRERQGAIEGLQSAFDSGRLKLVGDQGAVNFDPANAKKLAASVLVAHPDIDAFIVANDDMSIGVIKALNQVGKAGKVKVIGLDGLATGAQAILQGTMSATVVRSFDSQADAAAKIIAYTLAKKSYPKGLFNATYDYKQPKIPFVKVPFTLVTKDNLDLPITYGNLTKAEMCKGLPSSVGAPCN